MLGVPPPVHVGPLVYRWPDPHHLDTDWTATPTTPGLSSHQIARNRPRTPLEPGQGTDSPRHSRASRRPPGPLDGPATATPAPPPLRPVPGGPPCVVTHAPSPVPPRLVQCVQECASHGDSPRVDVVNGNDLERLRGPCVVDGCAARRIDTDVRSPTPGSPDTISPWSRPVRCPSSWSLLVPLSGLVDLGLHRRTGRPVDGLQDPLLVSCGVGVSPHTRGPHLGR